MDQRSGNAHTLLPFVCSHVESVKMDFKLCHFYRSNTFCIHIIIIIKGRKLGANTQRNDGIHTHARTAEQPNRNICWLRSSTRSLQRNPKLTQFHGINFHILELAYSRKCACVREWENEWQSEQMKMVCGSVNAVVCVCVCAVQSTAKLFGFNVYLRKIHPFQTQWCMSTILKNCQHDTHTTLCIQMYVCITFCVSLLPG